MRNFITELGKMLFFVVFFTFAFNKEDEQALRYKMKLIGDLSAIEISHIEEVLALTRLLNSKDLEKLLIEAIRKEER